MLKRHSSPPAVTRTWPSRQVERGRRAVPRTLTIVYPDGHREYWFTDQVYEQDDLLERAAATWVVVGVGDLNEAGKHTSVVVRAGGRPTPDGSERLRV